MPHTFSAILIGCLVAGSLQAQAVKPVWPDEGPFKWTPRPTSPDITPNDLRTRLYQFADDSMQGRRIGEPGNYKGTAYIASEFKRIGLQPGGEKGTFFQELPYGPLGFDSASSRLIASNAPLAASSDWVPIAPTAANGFGQDADLSGVPTVFAGRWGDTTALDAAAVRGKVAVFIATPAAAGLAGGRGGAAGGGRLERCDSIPSKFGAEAAAQVEAAIARIEAADSAAGRARRGRGGRGGVRDMRAANAGALGILLIALDQAPRAAVQGAFSERGGMEPMNATGPAAAAISSAAAAKLFGKPVDQLTVGAVGQPVTAHWSYAWHMSATPARNVIGIIRGSDPARASEYVLISAHNDHVGINTTVFDHDSLRAVNMVTRPQGANDPVCRPSPSQQHEIDSLIARARSIRPPRRDSIMNGADDDGSGTVILLEIAERMATEHPARSIIFVSHEGEEAGLLGSRWFTDHPTIALDSVVAALNMDMEAKGRVDQVKFGGPTSIQTLGSRRLSREFGDIIDSVNAVRPVVMAVDKTWDVSANPMNRFCRSDQVNYVHHNVPVTYFSTGYAEDYHQATDEPQYADYDHMAKVGGFVHDIAWAISQRRNKPAISGADPSYPACR
ncbi:MAG TPA: M28 family peptidase [Gemmatimonadaceae bacterium]|nr:M28 family peptidase [Gemmatimonadaceae bacterium]